jgi:pimeloyl-ACP methyl ester carboxylesterase
VINTAQQHDFEATQYATRYFKLTAYQHLNAPQAPVIHVYIEGDGNSWKTRYQLSHNPTPRQPLALRLAIQDPHPNVIYLARPCQYTPHDQDPLCHAKFWSSHRYAPEVIASVNEVLDRYAGKQFVLIGFSGGASVATLVAGQRQDVARLITVAGDLNHTLLNQYHQTTPLSGSLNPSDNIELVTKIPQCHWCGTHDRVVPCWTVEAFCKKANNPTGVQCKSVRKATHHDKWEQLWPTLLEESLGD